MKKFLKKLLIFILPLLLIAYPVDLFLSYQIKQSTNHAYKEYSVWNDLYNGKINEDIVVLGNSRAWGQVSPKILEQQLNRSAYNIGMDGQFFDMQFLRFKELLKNRIHPPKYVVSIVDEYFFDDQSDGIYNKEQFLPYMLFNHDLYEGLKNKSNFSFWEFYLPLVRYYGDYHSIGVGIKEWIGIEKHSGSRIKGYYSFPESWKVIPTKPYFSKIKPLNYEAYKQFIQLCQQKKIKLIMVYPPEHFSVKNIVLNRTKIIYTLKNIAKKYQLTFIDFSNSKLNLKKDYFYNRTHLNRKGSVLYTYMLADSLKMIINQ